MSDHLARAARAILRADGFNETRLVQVERQGPASPSWVHARKHAAAVIEELKGERL